MAGKRASSDKKLSEKLERQYSDQPAGSLERCQSGQSGSMERQYSGFTPILSPSGGPCQPDELILGGESPGNSHLFPQHCCNSVTHGCCCRWRGCELRILGYMSVCGLKCCEHVTLAGVIPDYSMRKLFINLLLALTSMYPDYDFRCCLWGLWGDDVSFISETCSVAALFGQRNSLRRRISALLFIP